MAARSASKMILTQPKHTKQTVPYRKEERRELGAVQGERLQGHTVTAPTRGSAREKKYITSLENAIETQDSKALPGNSTAYWARTDPPKAPTPDQRVAERRNFGHLRLRVARLGHAS